MRVALFILLQALQVTAWGVCSKQIYGSPRLHSCQQALAWLPRDVVIRYFVEQQLRPAPGTNWLAYVDPRPPSTRQKIVQVPKWWSSCPSPLYLFRQSEASTLDEI